MKKVAFVLIALVVFSGCTDLENAGEIFSQQQHRHDHERCTDLENAGEMKQKPDVWIEIHDVSPLWGHWRLEEILNVTEKYPDAYSKVVLFVIPNHGNVSPLRKNPEFVENLKRLAEKGYIIGGHGYTHVVEGGYEFNVTTEEVKTLVDMAMKEFEYAGLSRPNYFAPSAWIVSPNASKYLEENFDYVYYADHVSTPSGNYAYPSHEYTSFTKDITRALSQAKKDYIRTNKSVFRLTVHVYSTNADEGLNVLGEFLKWIQSRKEKS